MASGGGRLAGAGGAQIRARSAHWTSGPLPTCTTRMDWVLPRGPRERASCGSWFTDEKTQNGMGVTFVAPWPSSQVAAQVPFPTGWLQRHPPPLLCPLTSCYGELRAGGRFPGTQAGLGGRCTLGGGGHHRRRALVAFYCDGSILLGPGFNPRSATANSGPGRCSHHTEPLFPPSRMTHPCLLAFGASALIPHSHPPCRPCPEDATVSRACSCHQQRVPGAGL